MKNQRHLPRVLAALCSALILLAFAVPDARAQANSRPPGKMTFQGFLTDGTGVPIGNLAPTNLTVFFRLYKTATGTSAADKVYAEQQVVTFDKGHFSVLLGEGGTIGGEAPATNNLSAFFIGADASDRFIGIQIAGQAEVSPRIQFFPAPYAHLAQHANALVAPNGVVALSATVANLTSPLPFVAPSFSGSASNLTGLLATQIPNIDAAKITSGTLGAAQIPNLDGAKITTGILDDARLSPNLVRLAANQTFTGTNVFNANVGIGMDASDASLQINGGIRARGGPPGANGVNNIGYAFWGSGDNDSGMFSGRDGTVDFYVNDKFAVTIGDFGTPRVGINVVSPRASLEVAGNASFQSNKRRYNFNGVQGTDTLTDTYSAIFNNSVLAFDFQAFSDRRLKNVVGLSDSRNDLDVITRLRLTDYRLIDTVANGNDLKKGFIAQEVQAVVPEAVKRLAGFVPDIFTAATTVAHDKVAKTLTVTMAKAHQLKVSDRVRLMADAGQLDLKVTAVPTAQQFIVEKCEKAPKEVFVFGKEVPDMMTVNYERLFVSGIGAIQELAKRMDAFKASEARIAQLEQKASKVEALERDVAELKKLVARVAELRKDERPAGTPVGVKVESSR